LTFCRFCGKEVPVSAEFCPYCGEKLLQTSQLPPVPSPKKVQHINNQIWASILAIVIIVAAIGAAYVLINQPRPEITLTNGHDGFQGLNYVAFVDVNVKNNGAAGFVTVHSELSGGGRFEQQEQTVYLNAGEIKSVQFVFDISFWNSLFSSMSYRVWTT
jgi:hypothetical protein